MAETCRERRRVARPLDRRGFTLIELILVLAISGVLAAIGIARFASQEARAYSNDVKAVVQQARFAAVQRNAPVAVVWNDGAQEFQSILGTVSTPCTGVATLERASADEYRGISVTTTFSGIDGLVWLPSGQARSCTYAAFSDTIATISDARREFRVTVTLTGRVTIE